jgi:restriction endonuclease S subunit
MDYWAETMQDDVYMLVIDGWKPVVDGKPNIDMIPTALVISRYFAGDQAAIEQLEANRDAITRQMEGLDEEHGGEDGLLYDAKNERGKLTKSSVKARIAEIASDADATDERKLLKGYLALIENDTAATKKIKESLKALDAKVGAKYGKLSKDEIKTLVVDDKWLGRLAAVVQAELNRVSQALTGRIKELAERYAKPLPAIVSEVEVIASRVATHLKQLGATQVDVGKIISGKLRLPGYTGDWRVKRLGDVAAIKTGKKNNEDKIEDGQYPFFVRSQTIERINSYSFDGEAILVPGEGGIGSIFHYVNEKFDYHQRVYKISNFADGICGKFIYYCMTQTFNKQAMRNSVKATVDSLRLPTFLEYEFMAPSVKEQVAIAAVLSDMDAEAAALEEWREKTIAVKQALMQEVFAGDKQPL